MEIQADKRTTIRDEAKKLAALLMDAPDKTITPEMLDLARAVFRMASETKGNKDKLSIEDQHFLLDYIDNQMSSKLCSSKEQAAAKLKKIVTYSNPNNKNPFAYFAEKSLVKIYNNLKENKNLVACKRNSELRK